MKMRISLSILAFCLLLPASCHLQPSNGFVVVRQPASTDSGREEGNEFVEGQGPVPVGNGTKESEGAVVVKEPPPTSNAPVEPPSLASTSNVPNEIKGPVVVKEPPPMHGANGFVIGEGSAPIQKDEWLTRDMAILRAKQQAIEQAGIELRRYIIVNMGSLLDDIVKVQTFALVKVYKVIEEGRRGDEYWVRIRARVVPRDEEKRVMENLFAHRSIMMRVNGEGSQAIEKGLLARLTGGATIPYFVLAPGFAKWDPHYKVIIDCALKFSQRINGIESYHVDCNIRLVRRSNGRLVISETEPDDNRIYGSDKDKALSSKRADGFSRKIVEPMVSEFTRRLDAIAHVKEHHVDVIVRGIPSHKVFREEFCRMLRALRLGVKDVFNEHYDSGTGRVTVRYAEKTDYLAAMIGFRSQYRVEKFTRDRINVVYQGVIPFASKQKSDDKPSKSFEKPPEQSWQSYSLEAENKWTAFEAKQEEQWRQFKERVERKWDTFVDSTKKTWVDYGKDLDARSKVDFENGTVEITAIVPAKTISPKEAGADKIGKQVKKIFSDDNYARSEVLRDQVKNKKGEIVKLENLDQYIQEEIFPQVQIDRKPYKAKDGVERIKLKARIHLIPEHIRIRAEKYLGPVNKQAQRFGVEPQLIMAMIHAESFFNPLARSWCGALGLMQLMPQHGGREAYRFVRGKDGIPSAEYLYDPENNIELGTAYVHLLKNEHFADVSHTLKNRHLTICAYNCGPTRVKKILSRRDIDEMLSQELYSLLRKRTPKETRDYLKKVTQRIKIYDNFY